MLPLTELQYIEQMAIAVVLRSITILASLYAIYTAYKVLKLKHEGYELHYFRYRAIVLSLLSVVIFLVLIVSEIANGINISGYKTSWILYDMIHPFAFILFHNSMYFTLLKENKIEDSEDRYREFLKWYRKN